MALLTCTYPDTTGPVTTGVAVTASDTINANDVNNGAILTVYAVGTPTTVTFVDPGHTPAGTNAGTVTGVTVAANTSRSFGKMGNYINNATNLVTVTYSSTTAITCTLVA